MERTRARHSFCLQGGRFPGHGPGAVDSERLLLRCGFAPVTLKVTGYPAIPSERSREVTFPFS